MAGRHSSVPIAAQAVHAAGGHGEEVSGDVGRKRFFKMAFKLHFENGHYSIKPIKWLGVGSEYERRAACVRFGSGKSQVGSRDDEGPWGRIFQD